MTYPSYWTPEQVVYLKSLTQTAGIVDKHDHPNRLIMYSEEASILRYLQEPHHRTDRIKQGHTYLICDIGGSKVKMSLYEIKEPRDTRNNMKGEQRCDWDINYMNELPQLSVGAQSVIKRCEAYVLSRLSLPENSFHLKEGKSRKGQAEFGSLINDITELLIKNFSSKLSDDRDERSFRIPFSLQKRTLSPPTTSSGRMVGKTMLTLKPSELEENIFQPVCNQIIDYLVNIIGGASNKDIEAMILVGGFCHSEYLLDLIEDACKRTSTKLMVPFKHNPSSQFSSYEIVCGAIMKSMDKVEAHDPTTRIMLDVPPPAPLTENHSSKVFVFVDFGYLKTKVSYIHAQQGQLPDSANLNHITDWPGQSTTDSDLPTLDIMLIPRNRTDRNSTKRMISLKDNHNKQFLRLTQGDETYNKYYTFEQSNQGIVLVTHEKTAVERRPTHMPDNEIEDLQITRRETKVYAYREGIDPARSLNTHRCIEKYTFTVKRQLITTQEFSLLYFDYLTSFLFSYIPSKTGIRDKRQFNFCITRDNHAYPDHFTLTDEDIINIADRFGLRTENHRLLVLERAEATAIHCRQLLDTSDMSDRAAHLHFLQIQITSDHCLMLLNRVPFLDSKDSLKEKSWHGMHKYVKDKNVPFDFLDITAENMWTHTRTYQNAVLKRCGRHRSSKRFFNSSNMKVFKSMLKKYISTIFLDIEDGERVHTIYICNSGKRNCCQVHIANMDLLEFGMIPALNQLVSVIEGSIFNQYLYQGLQISDVFVMGDLFYCKDYDSYKFIDKMLLMKLRKINFRRLDHLLLQSMTKNTQVTKVAVQTQQFDDGEDQDAIDSIAASGSVTYGLNPSNRLLERFASRTYAIRIQISESNGRVINRTLSNDEDAAYVTRKHMNSIIKVTSEELIPVIIKESRLKSLTSIGEEIHVSFTVCNSLPGLKVAIGLFTLEDDRLSTWDLNSPNNKFDQIQNFVIENCAHPTYPVIFKTRVSQTKSYKFWVEYGKNEKKNAIRIRESILLKTSYITK